MHIHMVAIGSTGDVRPYVLLGKELRRRGHEVTIVAFANFAAMAEEAGLGFYPLAGDVMDFMERIMKPGVVGAKFLRQVEQSLRDVAPVLLHDLMEAFRGADAMICTFFGRIIPWRRNMASRWCRPSISPWTPTGKCPFPPRRRGSWGRPGTWPPIAWAIC